MYKSKAELALQEINEEIHLILTDTTQNQTSYFPNREKLLQAFQNYLKCIDVPKNTSAQKILYLKGITLFQEEICSLVFSKFGRLIHLISAWETSFLHEFQDLISEQNSPNKLILFALQNVSIVEIVFLMYLSLQLQRKKVFGNNLQIGPKRNLFLLKQITKLLQDFPNLNQNKNVSFKKQTCFSLNEDKLMKIFLLKSLKLKLYKKKMISSKPIFTGRKEIKIIESYNESSNLLESEDNQQNVQKNFSMISIRSEYQESNVFGQKLKKNLKMIPLKLHHSQFGLELQNLTNDDIFNYINLNESRGFFDQ